MGGKNSGRLCFRYKAVAEVYAYDENFAEKASGTMGFRNAGGLR
jgi:hypothetical protein